MTKQLYLVRHGDTEWTAAKRLQGQTDVPLSSKGRRQAEEVARHLAQVRFDAAYTSDLSRALETAQTILADHPVLLEVRRGLREISNGIYEGWSIAAALAADPRMALTSDDGAAALDYAPPKGESIRQVLLRQRRVASELMACGNGDCILVVGHNWALRLLASELLERGSQCFWKLEPPCPASLSIIRLDEGSALVTLWNQTRHLGGSR